MPTIGLLEQILSLGCCNHADGSLLTLPVGMQACTLPDTSLSFLREINIKLAEWEEALASQLQLAEQHLSSRLQAELRQRVHNVYSRVYMSQPNPHFYPNSSELPRISI